MTEVAVCVGFRPRNGHDQRCWDWVRTRWELVFPEYRLCVADSGSVRFNRSASRNLAATVAGAADVLIFCNSDTTFRNPNDVRGAVVSAASGRWVLPSLYVETSEAWTERVLVTDPGGEVPDPLSGYDRQLPDSCAGPQIVSAEMFNDVGSWDELFGHGWGWEDKALRDTLDVLHGPHDKIGTTVHLYHPRGVAESPGANGKNRMRWATKYKRAARQGPTAMRTLINQRSSST